MIETSFPATLPAKIAVSAEVISFSATISATAPLFLITTLSPSIRPANAPIEESLSSTIVTLPLTRAESITVPTAILLKRIPELFVFALSETPSAIATLTLFTDALIALPRTAVERSAVTITLRFFTLP